MLADNTGTGGEVLQISAGIVNSTVFISFRFVLCNNENDLALLAEELPLTVNEFKEEPAATVVKNTPF